MFNPSSRLCTWSLWASLLAASAAAAPLTAAAEEIAAADRVVVHKSQHKLYLYSGRRPAREDPGGLGVAPLTAAAEEIAAADRVVVHKSQHKLYLYSGSRLLGEYKVALGLSPVGQKEREHDFRTPEGRYFLERRNTRSDFFLAIQVSYPNKEDQSRARKHRWAPGGLIMIHGDR